jgi:hypothetical protein
MHAHERMRVRPRERPAFARGASLASAGPPKLLRRRKRGSWGPRERARGVRGGEAPRSKKWRGVRDEFRNWVLGAA